MIHFEHIILTVHSLLVLISLVLVVSFVVLYSDKKIDKVDSDKKVGFFEEGLVRKNAAEKIETLESLPSKSAVEKDFSHNLKKAECESYYTEFEFRKGEETKIIVQVIMVLLNNYTEYHNDRALYLGWRYNSSGYKGPSLSLEEIVSFILDKKLTFMDEEAIVKELRVALEKDNSKYTIVRDKKNSDFFLGGGYYLENCQLKKWFRAGVYFWRSNKSKNPSFYALKTSTKTQAVKHRVLLVAKKRVKRMLTLYFPTR